MVMCVMARSCSARCPEQRHAALSHAEDQSHEDLRAFHQAADNGNSALLQVNPGQHLDDSVIASSIVQGEGASNLNEVRAPVP